MDRCLSCGSTLETREKQMRSADEAQTAITSCPHCPVNFNKIDSTTMPPPPHSGIIRRVRRSVPHIPQSFISAKQWYTLYVDIPTLHKFSNIELQNRNLVHHIRGINRRASESSVLTALSSFASVEGPFSGSSVRFSHRDYIGMGTSLEVYDLLIGPEITSDTLVIRGYYEIGPEVCGYKTFVYSEYGTKTRKLLVDLCHVSPTELLLERLINEIYSMDLLPNNITRYVELDAIARYGNMSPRGWDVNIPPDSDHSFTCKPDGQNSWMIWSGRIWYRYAPRFTGPVKDWIWAGAINHGSAIVINVEDMKSHGLIILDCFTNETGDKPPTPRDVNWVIKTSMLICKLSPNLPLVIRQYFRSFDSAARYTSEVSYPVDGVVAVRDHSTEILKIKSIRSMELELSADGNLVTSESTPIVQCPVDVQSIYEPGSILEIRFTVNSPRSISITDIFRRTDKTVANSSHAVSNIVRSGLSMNTPDDNERRVALLWCNSVRDALHSRSTQTNPNKSIVVDIGTGDGQSLDSIMKSESVSHVFIEPDSTKCKRLCSRLSLKRMITDPAELTPMIRSLKTRAVNAIVLNCTIETVLENDRVTEMLFNETKSITCTFSMQFIVDSLHYICRRFNVPVYGCGYVYDNAKSNGILINDCGILMQKVDKDNATVKWGSDKTYTEPATTIRDYSGICRMVPGTYLVPAPEKHLTPKAHSICSNVMCIVI